MFTSPIAQNIVQFLSQGNTFSFEDGEIDFATLTGDNDGLLDLGNLLSTDDIMPSSPPKEVTMNFEYDGDINDIADWMEQVTNVTTELK